MMNDYELIYNYAQGDESALYELIERYKSVSYSVIRKYIQRNGNVIDRKELYQLSLITLYRTIISYQSNAEASFQTYYLVLLERDFQKLYYDYYSNKNKINRESVSLDQVIKDTDGLYLVDTLTSSNVEYNPKKYLELKNIQNELEELLETFKEEERKIFNLWVNGYSYKEIAALTNKTEKKIDNVVQKIKKKMKGSIDYNNSL